jgi:hypothetical protein
LRSILYKLAQKNQAMLQIAFIRESRSNQCFGKRNMEAKSSVEVQLDENAELRK